MGRTQLIFLSLLLTACAGNVPKPIAEAPPGDPSLAEVKAAPERYLNSRVRWGGTIANVDNRKSETLLQVLARPLGGSGRPEEDGRSQGRFVARFKGFVDPAVFAEGRALTVVGPFTGTMVEPIGEYPYEFPVVDVDSHYLWAPISRARDDYWGPPYWYDPWYPYPWYPYPYRPHPWYW